MSEEAAPLFMVLLHETDAFNPFFQTFWVRADHLGAALDLVRAAAAEDGLMRPRVCTAAPATAEAPEDAYPLAGERVWAAPDRHCYPPEVRHHFTLPRGVVLAGEATFDTDEIRAGFRALDEERFTRIDVVADASRLLEDYLEIVRRAGPVHGLCVKLLDHWEPGAGDLALRTTRIDSARKVEAHLRRDPASGIENGFVVLITHVREGNTHLNVTDHKVIQLLTEGKRMAKRLLAAVQDLGYRALDPYRSVEYDCAHYHYRPGGSLGRKALIARLRRQGFEA